jgi:hypothetical protein
VAIAKFKVKIFDTPLDLYTFVTADSGISKVTAIVSDSNGKYVLFYEIA